MSDIASPGGGFEDRNHFLLRKLHSLTGIVPVGFFLIEHLLTNSRAFDWFGWFGGGREAFNEDVHWLHHLPYLTVLEVLFIFVPLAFHAGYGMVIAMTAEPNVRAYRYGPNWRYTLQRVTGWIAVVFIVVHLFKFRLAHWIGWGPEFIGNPDPFEVTRRGLQSWKVFGDWQNPNAPTIPAAATFAFYVLGLWAAVFHFCNGIWSFCVSWGITIGERAQRRVGYAATGLAVVLLAWGHASLFAFSRAEAPSADMSTLRVTEHAVESEMEAVGRAATKE